jgi:hypothetical protein
MQLVFRASFGWLSFFVRRNPSSSLLVVPLLLSLAGCGGAAASMQSSQIPTPQPAGSGTPTPSQPSSPSTPSGSPGTPAGGSGSGPGSPPPPAGPPGVPAGADTVANVQTLPGWDWCTQKLNGKVCAAGLGVATSTMTPNQATPSLSGASSVYTLGGRTQYSNALWWKSFGPNSTPTHFVYDLYFYMQDPNLPEALEFDINQSMNGTRWTWGTECSYRNTGHWDIWNSETGSWETTDVPCPQVSANEWHHLTWTVERVNGQMHYISVELDGNVSTVDKYYNPQQHYGGSDVNVAFQMDGDYRQDPYSVWLDNVSLSMW